MVGQPGHFNLIEPGVDILILLYNITKYTVCVSGFDVNYRILGIITLFYISRRYTGLLNILQSYLTLWVAAIAYHKVIRLFIYL